MIQIIEIVILLGIIVFLICDKKGIKLDDKVKEKFSTILDKTKDFFKSVKRKTSENPENLSSVIETSDDDNESINDSSEIKEETINESNQKSRNNKKKIAVVIGVFICLDLLFYYYCGDSFLSLLFLVLEVLEGLAGLALFILLMIKFRWFRRLILFVLILCICITPFVYKKTVLDYDGKYATERIVYTEEYGFCMLITYYPDYHSGGAKGFAVTNIPFEALFPEEIQAYRNGNDTADSKEMLDSYQLLATLGDNVLVDSLAKFFLDSKISTRSIQIGKYGNYFAIKFDDFISKSNSKNSYEETDAKDLLSDSVEEDYSPILIRP